MPVAEVTSRIWAPSGIPTWVPTVRIPRSAPPEPNAGSDVSPDTRSGPAPPIWSAPIRVSIGRWQSKSDAERQDESGEKRFHARECTLNRDEVFPPEQKNLLTPEPRPAIIHFRWGALRPATAGSMGASQVLAAKLGAAVACGPIFSRRRRSSVLLKHQRPYNAVGRG